VEANDEDLEKRLRKVAKLNFARRGVRINGLRKPKQEEPVHTLV
jgi:hypothetical protein